MLPKLRLILDYTHFFGTEPPTNRISLLKGVSKKHVLYEIAGLNYRLKPNDRLKYDTSLETQSKELRYFCPLDQNLFKHYAYVASKYTKDKNNYPLIFNRAANLFALEEVLNSKDLSDIEDFDMRKVEVWDAIFKYLLAVNVEITKIKPVAPENLSLENISASSIVVNELMIEDNPFFVSYRGFRLIKFLISHPVFGREITSYFEKVLNIEEDRFIFNLLSLIIANKQEDKYAEFFYFTEEENTFLEFLSKNRIENNNPITLLSLRKTPFYKDSGSGYIVLDINFLINKCYNFFLNDFWFDYLKPQKDQNGKEKFKIKEYRGAFGLFFEKYVGDIIKNSFGYLRYPRPLMFDDLKLKTSDGQIEISDIYVRQNKNILIGQVKSGSVYDNEKYSGEINAFYKNDREKFFADFGVNQIISSIRNVLKHWKLFDSKCPVDKVLDFYPVIIVNEKVFQTSLMPNIFYSRFQELLQTEDFGRHKIHPLIIIHVSDLEYMETSLLNKKVKIWDVLDSHLKKNKLMPPFNITSDKFITQSAITNRVKEAMYEIIEEFSPEDE